MKILLTAALAGQGVSLPCEEDAGGALDSTRGPKDHINIRILHSDSKAQHMDASRNPVSVVFWGPIHDYVRTLSATCSAAGALYEGPMTPMTTD